MRYVFAAVVTAVLVGGCAGRDRAPTTTSTDWRRVATDADRGRLRGWREAWTAAMSSAKTHGDMPAIMAQGRLFDADRAMTRPVPPAGDYRCRVFKLGATRPYAAYPAFDCRIDEEGDVASFHKTGGSQRPVGLIFTGAAARAVFLGTMMFGDETRPIDYGRDAARDMAGFVDRIGERRWRIVLPYPRFESMLDVIEIVPVS